MVLRTASVGNDACETHRPTSGSRPKQAAFRHAGLRFQVGWKQSKLPFESLRCFQSAHARIRQVPHQFSEVPLWTPLLSSRRGPVHGALRRVPAESYRGRSNIIIMVLSLSSRNSVWQKLFGSLDNVAESAGVRPVCPSHAMHAGLYLLRRRSY